MQINEVAVKRPIKKTGFEDLYESSPEARLLIKRFMRDCAAPLHENFLRQTTALTEHYAFNPRTGRVLLEYRDADEKPQKLDVDQPASGQDRKAEVNDLLNAVAKASKSGNGYGLDKVVSFLKDKGIDKNKIAQALKRAKLDIRDVSFSGKGGDVGAAGETLKKYAAQLKKAKAGGNAEEAEQIAQDMLNLAKDHGDPKLDAAVKAALKKFKASDKQSNKDLTKSKRDAKLSAQQQAHVKAGQKADPAKMAAKKAELKAKHKPTESLIRDLDRAIREAYSRNKQRMLKESKLMEKDITPNQLITIVRSVSDYDLASQKAATADSAPIRKELQDLPNDVKKDIKQNREEAQRELDNLANSSEAHKFAAKLEQDPKAAEAAEQAALKAAKELEAKNPEAKGTLQKVTAFIKQNKGKAAMAAGIIGLLGFAAATGGVGALAPMAAAMGKGGLMGGGLKTVASGVSGAVKGWKDDQKGIWSKMKSAVKGGGKQIAADKGKIASGALFGALIGGGLHQWASSLGGAAEEVTGGDDAAPQAGGDTATRHSDVGDLPRDALDQGQGGEEVDVDDNSATDQWLAGQGGEVDYTVAKGDTLGDIAVQNKTTVQSIVDANPDITNPDMIQPGQELKIPQNTIETGDSVWQGYEAGEAEVPQGQEDLVASDQGTGDADAVDNGNMDTAEVEKQIKPKEIPSDKPLKGGENLSTDKVTSGFERYMSKHVNMDNPKTAAKFQEMMSDVKWNEASPGQYTRNMDIEVIQKVPLTGEEAAEMIKEIGKQPTPAEQMNGSSLFDYFDKQTQYMKAKGWM